MLCFISKTLERNSALTEKQTQKTNKKTNFLSEQGTKVFNVITRCEFFFFCTVNSLLQLTAQERKRNLSPGGSEPRGGLDESERLCCFFCECGPALCGVVW